MDNSWIGVDLDGVLAYYTGWKGNHEIGKPIPQMVMRVKNWIRQGRRVKIFTSRAAEGPAAIRSIRNWCVENGLGPLEVTNVKDKDMIELWDDRAHRVLRNKGTEA